MVTEEYWDRFLRTRRVRPRFLAINSLYSKYSKYYLVNVTHRYGV